MSTHATNFGKSRHHSPQAAGRITEGRGQRCADFCCVASRQQDGAGAEVAEYSGRVGSRQRPAHRVEGLASSRSTARDCGHERQVQVAERAGQEGGRRPAVLGLGRQVQEAGWEVQGRHQADRGGFRPRGGRVAQQRRRQQRGSATQAASHHSASGAPARSRVTARASSTSALVCTASTPSATALLINPRWGRRPTLPRSPGLHSSRPSLGAAGWKKWWSW